VNHRGTPQSAVVKTASQGSAELCAPALKRRLAAFVYEGVLLFGVVMVGAYLYTAGSRLWRPDADPFTLGLQAFLFILLGLYFGWFWSHGGQTVAMKAWHVRLVDTRGDPVSLRRALLRYILSWLWFAPALWAAQLSGLKSGGNLFGIVVSGVIAYSALSRLNPQRQFWHDVVCGTRLVDARAHPPAHG
jgi:uncharacterized RDD family membrane protein YckC